MTPFTTGLGLKTKPGLLRLQTLVRLRWICVAGQLVTVAAVWFWFGFSQPLAICLAVIAQSAGVNVALRLRYPTRHSLSVIATTSLLLFDVVQVAALLYLTGGLLNPFATLLIVPVVMSAIALPWSSTTLLGGSAIIVAGLLSQWHQPLPWHSGQPFDLPADYLIGLWASLVSATIVVGAFVYWLSKEASEKTDALAAMELALAREHHIHALDGLAAAAVHELGTPLSTIAVVAKELSHSIPSDHPLRDDVDLLNEQVGRCRRILLTLTDHPTDTDPHHATLSLSQLIEEVVEPYRGRGRQITVRMPPDPAGPSPADREPTGARDPGIIYGVGNIIQNAVRHAHQRVEIVAGWDGHHVRLVISDDGPGFSPATLDRLGDPLAFAHRLQTAERAEDDRIGQERELERELGSGLGLGLFIARTLLARSGAEIHMANRAAPGTGAVVTVTWPRSRFESAN